MVLIIYIILAAFVAQNKTKSGTNSVGPIPCYGSGLRGGGVPKHVAKSGGYTSSPTGSKRGDE